MNEWLLLFALIAGVVAFFRSRKLQSEFDAYRRSTEIRLDKLAAELRAQSGDAPAEPETDRPAEGVPTLEPADIGLRDLEQPTSDTPEAAEPPTPETAPPSALPEDALKPAPVAPLARPKQSFEESLTSRWFVWVGGIALALGGIFLVRYSIEQGLLGPGTRVTLAILAGLVLIAAGEWLRRQPLQKAIAQLQPDYVPPALSAAGLATNFAAIYAAYGLYDLISPVVAFVMLALVALAGLGLSLLQGPLIGALGLLGAFVAPALVSTEEPSAIALFTYLLFVSAASLAVFRYRNWPWLAAWTIAAAMIWPLIWIIGPFETTDTTMMVVYLLATMGLVIGFAPHTAKALIQTTDESLAKATSTDTYVVLAAGAAVALVALALFAELDFGPQSIFLTVLLSMGYLAVGRYYERLYLLPVASAVLAGLVLLWLQPDPSVRAMYSHDFAEELGASIVVGGNISTFIWLCVLMGALYSLAGFFAVRSSARPGYWAALSGAGAVTALVISYYRVTGYDQSLVWGLAASGLALAALVAADRMRAYGYPTALVAYAVTIVAFTTLAMTMTLRQAWLTVALAAQLPAIAWIYTKYSERALRVLALIIGLVVLGRLLLNWNIFAYPISATPFFNWTLYGYGLPALAFWGAARIFGRDKKDMAVQVLEGGAFTFTVVLISMQIRHWVNSGSLDADYFNLFEVSLHTSAWLAISVFSFWRNPDPGRTLLSVVRSILFVVALLQILILHLLFLNPIFDGDSVGTLPVFNVLLLAYGVPGVLLALYAAVAWPRGLEALAKFCGAMALFLTFVNVSLEVRRAFRGPDLSSGAMLDGELYAYSVVWLLYAFALLGLGMWTKMSALRYASLVILALTIGKVFLFDMSALEGLYRALSFFGLGLALVSVGLFYQRVVFANPTASEDARPAE